MPVAIGISILLAELSFRFVESPFLKLKSRRIRLQTTNPAPQPRLAEADS
jgi:peptidoglycan/LPS O-acetylase OafA/YrhL